MDISLPYFAPREQLPAKLPSKDEIEHGENLPSRADSYKLVAVGPHFVVKYGSDVEIDEGKVMIFIHQQELQYMRIPKVYALYEEDGKVHIVMERIAGDNLENQWPHLSTAEKKSITRRLKPMFAELRAIPGHNYCKFGQRPLDNYIFKPSRPGDERNLAGPFETESQLNDAIIQTFVSSGSLTGEKLKFYTRRMPYFFSGHPPTFTHGDLQRRNIMWNRADDSIVIIDWEYAGWWPSYWEWAWTTAARLTSNDWHDWLPMFLQPYMKEEIWLQVILPLIYT